MSLKWNGCFGSGCNSQSKIDSSLHSSEPVQAVTNLGGLNPVFSVQPVQDKIKDSCSCDTPTYRGGLPGRLFAVVVLLVIGLIYNYMQK